MKRLGLTLFFLIVNFGGLFIGNLLMNNGPQSEWYLNLEKAPWTPPGWLFGVAWTIIMICFSFYLERQFNNTKKTLFLSVLFSVAFLLNVSWNFLFFNQHLISLALINIIVLTAVLFYYFFKRSQNIGKYKYLLIPYMVWLCIATSLNLYIFIKN